MIKLLVPGSKFSPKIPVVIMSHELLTYDFSAMADHIFNVASTLNHAGFFPEMPYRDSLDVLRIIGRLLQDIDPNIIDHQISEMKHIRLEYIDEMLSVEFFIGV